MSITKGYAAKNPSSALEPFSFQRRDLNPTDILIEILYCGICHSDIHQARDEWGGSIFPMVPGHEIVGEVKKIGSAVKKFKVGDTAGVGCFVDSCRTCSNCKDGLEQYCEDHLVLTYNSLEKDKKTPTYGGYSSQIVVNENYGLLIPKNLDLERTAPLLCAGITTYSPLKHSQIKKGHRVAIAGLGGLGHMGVKFAAAMGAEVTVLSTSPKKAKDAEQLGAHHFAVVSDSNSFTKLAKHFDVILNTIAVSHNIEQYIKLLKRDGTMIMVGIPSDPLTINVFSLIQERRKLMGSAIGGIAETQEMLNYCAEHNVMSDVEVIPIQKVNEAFERTLKSDVRYRFVIDMKSL